MRRNRLVLGGLVAGGAMLTAAGLVIGAGIARADITGDALFDAAMIHFAVPGSATHLRADAHQVCSELAAGYSFTSAGMSLYAQEQPRFSVTDSAHLAVAAVYAYCPSYKPVMDAETGGA
jgi:hypothetical protein